MRKHKLRSRKTAAVLTVAVAAVAVWATTSLAASHAATVKVAIMTDCKGAFAFGYEQDIGGAQAAFAKWAHGKVVNKNKPSAGMTGINVNGTPIKIVGYGCGNDTVPLAVTETKRLMEKLGADVMIGPLSGDEAVYVANYAKSHPTKTFINGTAGSQDPTMQIAPKNQFRYHGDGAQWNAGAGELAYKKRLAQGGDHRGRLQLRLDVGRRLYRRLLRGGRPDRQARVPAAQHDGLRAVRPPAPPPNQVDGYFSTVGGTGTSAMLKAYEQAYGKINPKQWIGNLFFTFLGADKTVGPKVIGSYVGGFGTAAGLKTPVANAYRAVIHATYPSQDAAADSGFVYNYYNAAWALVQGLQKSGGAVGAKLGRGAAADDQARLPGLERRCPAPRLASPGNPGSVPDPDDQEARRVGCSRGRGLRAQRRSVVRRPLQAVEPAARARAASVQEAEAAVDGQDPRHQERQDHEPGVQVGVDRSTSSRARRADPPSAGGRPAVRRSARSSGGRPRDRRRRAAGDPRPERGGQDDPLQRDLRGLPRDVGEHRAVRQGRDSCPCAGASEDGPGAHLPAVPALRRADGRGQHLPLCPRHPRRAHASPRAAQGRASTASGRERPPGGPQSTTSSPSSAARSRTASIGRSHSPSRSPLSRGC